MTLSDIELPTEDEIVLLLSLRLRFIVAKNFAWKKISPRPCSRSKYAGIKPQLPMMRIKENAHHENHPAIFTRNA